MYCTKDVIYQEFKMDEVKLKEYEEKWLTRVRKYHDDKKSLGDAKPSNV